MFRTTILQYHRQRESPSFRRVQQTSEDRRGIEIRETKEVDRSVDPDQSRGLQVANNSVVLDGLGGGISVPSSQFAVRGSRFTVRGLQFAVRYRNHSGVQSLFNNRYDPDTK